MCHNRPNHIHKIKSAYVNPTPWFIISSRECPSFVCWSWSSKSFNLLDFSTLPSFLFIAGAVGKGFSTLALFAGAMGDVAWLPLTAFLSGDLIVANILVTCDIFSSQPRKLGTGPFGCISRYSYRDQATGHWKSSWIYLLIRLDVE